MSFGFLIALIRVLVILKGVLKIWRVNFLNSVENFKIMVIEVLSQKYLCDCNKGIYKLQKPGILGKLNAIIEWDFCKFPRKERDDSELTSDELALKEKLNNISNIPEDEANELLSDALNLENTFTVEDRSFLGDDPELKPGNCFLFRGQVIAVNDNDSLVLVVSETGALALDRIWAEHIEPELKLMFNTYETGSVTHEPVDINNIPENLETYNAPYSLYKIWKDKYVKGRGYLEKGMCIKTVIESDTTFFPVTLYLLDWTVKYNPEEIEEDQIETVVHELLSWFYEKYPRL